MTEDEKFNDVSFLRGRINALEAVVQSMLQTLPTLALRSVKNSIEYDLKREIEIRDADPVHIDWDRHERSHFPKDREPPITLRTGGFSAAIEDCITLIEHWEHDRTEARDGFGGIEHDHSIIATNPKAVENHYAYVRLMQEIEQDD